MEYDAHLGYPPDVYRNPNYVWPKDLKIDHKKMVRDKIVNKIKSVFGWDD